MRLNPRIGGPNALSWPAFWAVLAISITLSLPDRYTAWTPATWWRNLLCIAISVITMFAVMALLRAIVMRHAASRPRPWRAIAIFAVGAVVRALALATLIPFLSTGEAQPAYRLVVSLIVLVPLLAITASLVDLTRTSAATRAALQAKAADLVAAEQEATARTVQLRERAVGRVRSLLLDRLQEIGEGRSARLEDALRGDVDRVIRPMSHQLFAGEEMSVPKPSVPPVARVAWGDVWRSASLGTPFRPVAMATIAALGCLSGLVTYNGSAVRGIAYAALEWLLVFAAFALVGATLARLMRGMGAGLRTVTLVLAFVGAMGAATLAFGALMLATGGADPWRLSIGLVLTGPVVALVLALDQGFRRQVVAADSEQAAANAALQMSAALAGSVWRHEERRLSRALHGPVQTAVRAAAIRIEAGDQAGAEAMLAEAIGQLEPGTDDTVPVAAALDEIAAVWDGLCAVDVDLDPGLQHRIDARPAVAEALVEICAEACLNAVRHGGARHVMVTAQQDGDVVQAEVRDDGAPAGPESASGLGTALLDEVTLSWERYRDGDLTVMRATLPLAA